MAVESLMKRWRSVSAIDLVLLLLALFAFGATAGLVAEVRGWWRNAASLSWSATIVALLVIQMLLSKRFARHRARIVRSVSGAAVGASVVVTMLLGIGIVAFVPANEIRPEWNYVVTAVNNHAVARLRAQPQLSGSYATYSTRPSGQPYAAMVDTIGPFLEMRCLYNGLPDHLDGHAPPPGWSRSSWWLLAERPSGVEIEV